jgi:hypothetical protein
VFDAWTAWVFRASSEHLRVTGVKLTMDVRQLCCAVLLSTSATSVAQGQSPVSDVVFVKASYAKLVIASHVEDLRGAPLGPFLKSAGNKSKELSITIANAHAGPGFANPIVFRVDHGTQRRCTIRVPGRMERLYGSRAQPYFSINGYRLLEQSRGLLSGMECSDRRSDPSGNSQSSPVSIRNF